MLPSREGFQNGVLLTLEWFKKVLEGVEATLFNEDIYDYEHSLGSVIKTF